MADPYIGEIRPMAFNYAPSGWGFCVGSILQINSNQALYALLSDAYGGNGRTNFALPNLAGRVPLGHGRGPGLTSRQVAERGGYNAVPLDTNEMPRHSHSAYTRRANPDGINDTQTNAFLSRRSSPTQDPFFVDPQASPPTDTASLDTIGTTGMSAPHENRQPFLCINYCINMDGTFPPRP